MELERKGNYSILHASQKELAYRPVLDNPICLDFTGCRYPHQMFKTIIDGLGLPITTGENWSAIYDFGWGYSNDDEPVTIEVRGLKDMPKGFERDIELMKITFEDIHKSSPSVQFVYLS
ncbi:MAG: barstar family protein [Ruminococcaceae bacterium]|nr:barstar family protein [Oscillospiraceae bacterium]